MRQDYRFLYHFNTYTKKWAAMTMDSVGHYNLLTKKGNYAFGKTMTEANINLTKKLT